MLHLCENVNIDTIHKTHVNYYSKTFQQNVNSRQDQGISVLLECDCFNELLPRVKQKDNKCYSLRFKKKKCYAQELYRGLQCILDLNWEDFWDQIEIFGSNWEILIFEWE